MSRICAFAIAAAPAWVDYPVLACADNDPAFPFRRGHWAREAMARDGFEVGRAGTEREVATAQI
eukprot:6364181-Alexandrium_andersonii.AAC.1